MTAVASGATACGGGGAAGASSMTTCMVYCLVGFTLVVAMVWTMMNKGNTTREFERSLDRFQRKKYVKLVDQRKKNALVGALAGVALAVAFHLYYRGEVNEINTACIMTCIVMLSLIGYYMAMAPTKSITDYLSTDQLPLWVDTHRAMIRNFGTGVIIGVAGFFLLSLGGQTLAGSDCGGGL